MRKSIKHILLAGLTVVSTAMTVNAQTLTQDWKVTEGLPAASNARWGVGKAGKVYTNDKSVPQILAFTAEGSSVVKASCNGTAISVDDAGNFIVNDGFPNAASSTTFKIFPADGSDVKELTVTLPEGVTAGRMDFIGRTVGNVLSEAGGAFYITPATSGKVAKIFVANGAQVAEKSKAFTAAAACASDGVAQPVGNDPESDNFVVRPARARSEFSQMVDGAPVEFTTAGTSNLTAGGDAVVLDGTLFTFETSGTNYVDGFQVVNRTSNEVVATHENEATSPKATPNQNALSVEKVDEYTARVYQYVPGQMAAQYTFSIPKPLPQLEARNAFAYDIQLSEPEEEGGDYTLIYRLNAPAESVKVLMLAEEQVVKEYEGTTNAHYADYEKTTVDNYNTVTIPNADIPRDKHITFQVVTTGATVAEPTPIGNGFKFYHPSSVEIDNDPDSPNFGRILVAEAMPSPATGYHSSGEGQGIYAFDATLEPIKNEAGTYAFKGGQTFQSTFANGKSSYEPRKIRLAADGRLFISAQNTNGVALWEADPVDLEEAFTPVIRGTSDAATYEIKDIENNFVAAPNVSMDLKGEGENLTVLMLSTNKAGTEFSYSGYRTDEYDLGTAESWEAAPSRSVEALSGKYTIAHSNTTVAYDNEGGIWYANSRSTAKDAEPTLVHINAEGVEDYKVDSNDKGGFYGGGALRFSPDFSLLAIGTSDKTITVFEVSKDANGAPVLTQKYKFNTNIGRNCNDIAWDYANNLYFVGNSGEWMKAVALPRESGVVTVDAAEEIIISSDEYPAALYMIGSATDWDPETGTAMEKHENGIYKGIIDGPCNFSFVTTLDDDWEVVNAGRYGFSKEDDNKSIELNKSYTLVKGEGAINVPFDGTFDVTVDLKNMTVIVEGEAPVVYPKKLYLIGTVEPAAWDPADDTHVAAQISEGIYMIENVSILAASDADEYGYFAFTSTPGTWDEVNAHRYGPAEKDTELADKTMSAIGLNGDTSYKIKSGAYSITVDLGLNTIYAVRLGDNVNDAAVEAAKVVAGIGEIRIIGEANAVSIFNAAGQAVAVNSKDAQFFVASGIYVVVVDGKATKVLVK